MRVWKRMSFDANFTFNFSSRSPPKKLGDNSRDFGQAWWCAPSHQYLRFAKPGIPTNRRPSWQVHGVRNDKIFFSWTSTKLALSVVADGICESSFLEVPFPNSLFALIVVIVKSYNEKFFTELDSMKVSIKESYRGEG